MRVAHVLKASEVVESRGVKINMNRNLNYLIEWPHGFLKDLFDNDVFKERIPSDIQASIEYVFSSLGERNKQILLFRYKEHKTLSEISKMFNITRNRVQEIIKAAIRKIKNSDYILYIQYGVRMFIVKSRIDSARIARDRAIDEYIDTMNSSNAKKTKKPNIYINDNTPIEYMQFKPRTYNLLKRSGINTIADLKEKEKEKLFLIRGFGIETHRQIIEKLENIGIDCKKIKGECT